MSSQMELHPSQYEIYDHYCKTWSNKPSIHAWERGPVDELPRDFRILKFPPTASRNMWTYATLGMSLGSMSLGESSAVTAAESIEIHLFAPQEQDSLIELLTVVAHYHRNVSNLGVGHTVNFGRPWWPGSKCEHGLLSLPYLDGPSLEWLEADGQKTRFLWLIPITKEEVDYKKKAGLEALEKQFDKPSFNYLNPLRASEIRTANIP